MAEEILIDIQKKFPTNEVSFQTTLRREGTWTVLFGPSGAGKTTILRCIAGLEKPDRGTIRFGADTWYDSRTRYSLPTQKRRIGYFFQDYALFPHLSVWNNIGYNFTASSRREKEKRIGEMIDLFHLRGLERRLPRTLSGGEKQRVALARTLLQKPNLLLLDEPLSALDGPTRIKLRKELRHQLSQFGVPILLVTHDRTEALSLGDRLIVLDRGQKLQEGPIHEVFSKPNQKAAAEIIGMENMLPGKIVDKKDGLAQVRVHDVLLTALANDCEAGDVMVGIRAEEILLQIPGAGNSSARNKLPGTVRSTVKEESMVRLTADCGFLIDVLITREACEEMNLNIEKEVVLSIKVPSIHLFPHQ
ncbi:MAG: ABC transporter ATP-binding protein [Nitrospinales bacterium]